VWVILNILIMTEEGQCWDRGVEVEHVKDEWALEDVDDGDVVRLSGRVDR